MADHYEEDDSIAPEHAAADIGAKISWGARALDAVGGLMSLGGAPQAGETLGALGITGFAPVLAGFTAAGEGLKVMDDLAHGEVKKAGKHTVVGAAKAGVVFLDGATMGLAEIPSLLFTGKFLSTNVGNVVGQMLDGADKAIKPASAVAGVGFSDPRYAMAAAAPADSPQQVAPYGMEPPPGGWRNYIMAQRQGGMVQQPGGETAPVMSGNPRFTSAVEVAKNAARSGGQPQLGSAG